MKPHKQTKHKWHTMKKKHHNNPLLLTKLMASTNEIENSSNNYPLEPKTYPQRWVQLAYLSLLALLSDWICFSVAASPDSFEHAYPGSSAANLIDIFLFTNVVSCFLVTDVVAKFGLGKSIKGAAALMSVGCLLGKCALCPFFLWAFMMHMLTTAQPAGEAPFP